MDMHCIHCSELVESTLAVCRACGGDPRVRGDNDFDVIDLTKGDAELEAAQLLAGLVAGYDEHEPRRRPAWGANSSTPLELELEPIRLGQGKLVAADVLPSAPTRRLRRRS